MLRFSLPLALLSACASESAPVALEWFTDTAACDGGEAYWTVPEPTPAFVQVRQEQDGAMHVSSEIVTGADRTAYFPCSADVSVTYAMVID